MPDKITKYLQANDNADDYADSLLLGLRQRSLEDIDSLITSVDERDEELWDDMDVDSELELADYENIEVEERGFEWILGLSGIAAAASTQFFLDNRDDTLIKPLAYREQVVGAFALTMEELIIAGKRGTEIIADTKFVALQQKYLNEFAYLAEMSNAELYVTLSEIGALQPAEQVIARSTGYVSRMTTYKKGSPQFKAEVSKLIDAESKRAITGANRRAVERIYSFREADGDLNTLMVWVGENDKRTCSYCAALFGEVDTYGNWIERGLPGADVCAGGDLDRCHLASAG